MFFKKMMVLSLFLLGYKNFLFSSGQNQSRLAFVVEHLASNNKFYIVASLAFFASYHYSLGITQRQLIKTMAENSETSSLVDGVTHYFFSSSLAGIGRSKIDMVTKCEDFMTWSCLVGQILTTSVTLSCIVTSTNMLTLDRKDVKTMFKAVGLGASTGFATGAVAYYLVNSHLKFK